MSLLSRLPSFAPTYVKVTAALGAATGYVYATHRSLESTRNEHRSACTHAAYYKLYDNEAEYNPCSKCFPNLFAEIPIYAFVGAVAGPFALPVSIVYGPAKLYRVWDQRRIDNEKQIERLVTERLRKTVTKG